MNRAARESRAAWAWLIDRRQTVRATCALTALVGIVLLFWVLAPARGPSGSSAGVPTFEPKTRGGESRDVKAMAPNYVDRQLMADGASLEGPASPVVDPDESVEEGPITLEDKYRGWTIAELAAHQAGLQAVTSSRVNELLEQRLDAGIFEIRGGVWDDELGGYAVHRDPRGPFSAWRTIPGDLQYYEVAELPQAEYPDVYALRDEWRWLSNYLYERRAVSSTGASND